MIVRSNLEFRKIKSLDYLYEVSEDGRIFRNVKSKKQQKIVLDMHHSKTGYYAVWVCIKNKMRRVMIHKAVAECWLGDKPEGYEIDHIDRDAHNNHYTNLRYVTHSEQMRNRVLSDRIIEQAKANCMEWVRTISHPVRIRRDGVLMEFPSMTKCAEWLGIHYGKPTEHMRCKLKARRSHIYDYDVLYLRNAETGHGSSTEQGTVQQVSCGDDRPLERRQA
jgi:hypothetical protein